MQITFSFDTANKTDLNLLNKIVDFADKLKSQPEVEQNTGTTATGSTLSPEGSGVSEGAVAEAAAPAPEKPKRAKKAAPVAEPADDTTPSESEPVVTGQEWAKAASLDEVRAALQSFTAANGVPAGIELLKKYNAARISELAEENYGAFIADCK